MSTLPQATIEPTAGTAVPGASTPAQPRRTFSVTPIQRTPAAPSTTRDDPSVVGPQSLVYDSSTGAITVAGDGIRLDAVSWMGTGELLVRLGGSFAVYNATSRTWRKVDAALNLDTNSFGVASKDGSMVAIRTADKTLALLDMKTLTHRVLSLAAFPVSWSPDASMLLISHEGQARRSVILARDADSVVDLPGAWTSYEWLDDSRLVAFEVRAADAARVLLVSLTGGTAAIVLEQQLDARPDSISPDGRYVAASRSAFREPPVTLIYRLQPFALLHTLHGAGPLQGSDPWTSDSRGLLALRDWCTADERIVVIDAESGNEAPLIKADAIAVALSPDDRTLAYTRVTELYTVPMDGSAPPSQIFALAHAPARPEWSADGRFLLFTRYFGGYGRCP